MPTSVYSSGDRFDSLIQAITQLKFNLVPAGAPKATITVSPIITTVGQKVIAANPARLGLILYNNSANSVYLALGSPANSNTNMTFILATFAHLILPTPIYTGDIYGIRNGAGTGTVIATEIT